MDHSQKAISASNVMTNITPQQSSFNRTGAWRETEKRIECWRDRGSLQVWIGVIAGDDASNDFVTATHGIITPDYFIKLVIKGDEAIAWEFPNQKIRAKQLDDYSVSPILAATKIEELTGANITDQLPPSSDPQNWPRLSCDQS